ncbi:MAG: amidohydrolase [Acidobacteriota bacterium]
MKEFLSACALLPAALLLIGCAEPPAADRILLNARIWTGWKEHPEAEAIAIRADRIMAVGRELRVRRFVGPSTHVEDMRGRRIVPGFIDSHTHLIEGGRYLLGIDLRNARNAREMAARVRRYAARLPVGRWIQGGNWDHERWGPALLPSRDSIDPGTPDHPVLVSRLDGHMALANSLALSLAGIRRDTPDPPGGLIDRDPRTGQPTGILRDAAIDLVLEVVPPPSIEELDGALAAALAHAALLGVTSVHDISSFEDLDTYQRAHQRGNLTLRIYARTPLTEWRALLRQMREHGRGDEWLHLGGLKGYMDGSLGSHTAYFFEPYEDAPGTHGLLREELFPEGAMLERIAEADAAGLQVSVHAIGDRANAMLLDFFETTRRRNGPRPRRMRVEHAQHLRAPHIPRFGGEDVIASMQPHHAFDDGVWAQKRIGAERCRTTYAFRSLLDSGARLAFGSDWPVVTLDPLQGLYAAATRHTADGRNPGGWVPEQKITVEEALIAYTRDAAYAEFEEQHKGVLRPGYLADLVVLSRDILAMPADEIPQARVEMTIVGGLTVFSAPATGGQEHTRPQ